MIEGHQEAKNVIDEVEKFAGELAVKGQVPTKLRLPYRKMQALKDYFSEICKKVAFPQSTGSKDLIFNGSSFSLSIVEDSFLAGNGGLLETTDGMLWIVSFPEEKETT